MTTPGTYVISAVPFAFPNAAGLSFGSYSTTIQIVNQTLTPTPTLTPTATPTVNPNWCFTTLTQGADVYASSADVAALANNTSATVQDALLSGTAITVTAIHPNREYAQIQYVISSITKTGWARVRINTTDSLRFDTTNCNRSKIETLVQIGIGLLSICNSGQIVSCRPSSPASNLLQPTIAVLHGWGSTTGGCSNASPLCIPDDPCPLLPPSNNQHCGVDLTSTTSPNVYSAGLYQGGDGVLCEYSVSIGNVKLRERVLVGGNYQIWEYQYTHVASSLRTTGVGEFGEYVALGTLLGQYQLGLGTTGDVAHVHVVIKVFADNNTDRLCGTETAIVPPGYLNPFDGSPLP